MLQRPFTTNRTTKNPTHAPHGTVGRDGMTLEKYAENAAFFESVFVDTSRDYFEDDTAIVSSSRLCSAV